jgi:apolipoprotein N-acyltransferase
VGVFFVISLFFTTFVWYEVVDGPIDGQLVLVTVFLTLYSCALVALGMGVRALAERVRKRRQ